MPESNPIELLLTGDELMSGDTVDSNSSRIAQTLGDASLSVARKTTVGDDRAVLVECLRSASERARVIIMNGGLGPTLDDLTAEVAAEVAGVPLVESETARRHVLSWCERRGIQANAANLKQALLPEGAEIIDNPRGSAVGFALQLSDCLLLTTPGVPSELTAMMPEIMTRISAVITSAQRHTLRLQTVGIGESSIEALVRDGIPDWPKTVQLGYRAGLPQLELKLHVEHEAHLPQRDAVHERFKALFGDHILGLDDTTLAGALQQALQGAGLRVTAAESCTGGLIASMITREPGSSSVFEAGFVTYANQTKQDVLGVSTESLEAHGAVSEPVVREMLAGALSRSGADIGVAVSGIAGPGGGTEDKPVGTVWIAWGTTNESDAVKLVFPAERHVFQTIVAAVSLDLIRRQVLRLPKYPSYIARQAI